MSKAEKGAEEYCHSTLVGSSYIKRMAYIEGYHQAEKDLLANKHEKSWRLDEKLWKRIKDIEEASYQYTYDASNDWAYDVPTWDDVQDAFKAGSEWKEGLELTWEQIYSILYFEREVLREFGNEEQSNEEVCKEVLKRFKDFKESKEK